MMNICVPAIYDKQYLNEIVKLNANYRGNCQIFEMYGSLPKDVIGNLRPAWAINDIGLAELKEFIEILHESGIQFEYIINSTIYPIPIHQTLGDALDFIGELVDVGVDSLTITNPFLITFVKEHYPNLKITASISNEISTIQQVIEFDNLGVDCIVLDRDVNRNFEFLKRAVKSTKKQIKLLCNSSCVFQCINVQYHANYSSFLSNCDLVEDTKAGGKTPFCSLYCKYRKFSNPIEHIKTPWIRPEDLNIYNKMGIQYFKIDGRDKSTSFVLEVVESYLRQNYSGNFLRLLNKRYIDNVNRICCQNALCAESNGTGIDDVWKIWIDNRDLDGFVDSFITSKRNCLGDCIVCKACDTLSDRLLVDCVWQKQICEKLSTQMKNSVFLVE